MRVDSEQDRRAAGSGLSSRVGCRLPGPEVSSSLHQMHLCSLPIWLTTRSPDDEEQKSSLLFYCHRKTQQTARPSEAPPSRTPHAPSEP